MTTYASATDFVVKALNYRDGERASTLKSVVAWLLTVSGDGHYDDQLTNLERWAIQAEPADYKKLHIRGFAIGGFEYLRMLFSANTTKPDIHIRR